MEAYQEKNYKFEWEYDYKNALKPLYDIAWSVGTTSAIDDVTSFQAYKTRISPTLISDKYGNVGQQNVSKFEIPFDGVTAPSLNAVSVNQRSVCALVSDENSDSTMWCWGSKTFGQLGLEYQSNPAYSFGDAQDAWKLEGGFVNDYYDADDALLTQTIMSGVEIQ